MTMRRSAAAMALAVALSTACASTAPAARAVAEPHELRAQTTANAEVYAINYGTLPRFAVSGLIAGADTSRRMDIALMIWLIKRADGRNVLVDAGFYREKFMRRWRPTNYVTPAEAVRLAGVTPEAITDIIVSHVHWDHADGIDLFPNARVWMQRAEFEHHITPDGRALDRTIDSLDAAMFGALTAANRMRLVDGDDQEIMSGIRVYTGGKHTFASQFASVLTPAGVIVLASDNAYLYENLDTHRPIAQTLDSASNLRAQERMKALASEARLIVPGHDPAVMTRFGALGSPRGAYPVVVARVWKAWTLPANADAGVRARRETVPQPSGDGRESLRGEERAVAPAATIGPTLLDSFRRGRHGAGVYIVVPSVLGDGILRIAVRRYVPRRG